MNYFHAAKFNVGRETRNIHPDGDSLTGHLPRRSLSAAAASQPPQPRALADRLLAPLQAHTPAEGGSCAGRGGLRVRSTKQNILRKFLRILTKFMGIFCRLLIRISSIHTRRIHAVCTKHINNNINYAL